MDKGYAKSENGDFGQKMRFSRVRAGKNYRSTGVGGN
jgi:hypothetical protein